MPVPHEKPIPSKVAILQHPLHPMAVSFPIAFLSSNFVTDVVYWWSGNAFWAHVSFWLASAGFVMGVLAALLGMSDFFLMREVRRHVAGWSHFIAAVMVLALAGTNVQLRWDSPVDGVVPWGLFVSANMSLMLGITGWLGGTLTFRHGIGTYSHEYDDVEAADEEVGDEPAGPIKE
jgi:uncharacterized membrane protein